MGWWQLVTFPPGSRTCLRPVPAPLPAPLSLRPARQLAMAVPPPSFCPQLHGCYFSPEMPGA